MLAGKVDLMVQQDASSKADAMDGDKLIPIRNLKFDRRVGERYVDKRPIEDHDRDPLDTVLSFSFTATRNSFMWIHARTSRTRDVILSFDWAFKATSSDGASESIRINGKMIKITYSKNGDSKDNSIDVYCCIQMPDYKDP